MSASEGRFALVTGASAGIGEAFARELAARGLDLVLTARRAERLAALADELGREHGRRVEVVPLDLAEPGAPAALFDELAARRIELHVLVNNAGYGLAKRYAESLWAEQAEFIQVMVTAVAELTHRALPGMLERGSGRVINVASLAGLLHGPARSTLYAASKAFMIKLSESLSLELLGTGVTVTAVCPGLTYSEFHDVNGTRSRMGDIPRILWMDSRSVARVGVDAAWKGDTLCVTGGVNKLIAGLLGRLPHPIAHRLLALQAALETRAEQSARGERV